MNPTDTPLPVMLSDRAVGAEGFCESAWICSIACGSSWTWPLGAQALGSGAVGGPVAAATWAVVAAGEARWMTWSATTSETLGLLWSRLASAGETVAAMALMVL